MNFDDTMTAQNLRGYSCIRNKKTRDQRLIDWALMLEHRVAELDPDYRAFPWGRKEVTQVLRALPASRQLDMVELA